MLPVRPGRRPRVLAASLCLVALATAQQQRRPNALKNASFEELDAGGRPRGWRQTTWSGKPTFAVESRFARTGERCVRISSTAGADASWSFEVEVEPETRYRLRAWVKTEGLERGSSFGALMNLHELQKTGKTRAISGTEDWTLLESTFETGGRRRLLVNCLFGGWGWAKGTAWFDDIELVALTPPLPVLTPKQQHAFYRDKVHPILSKSCYSCHGPKSKLRGDLFLGSREGLLAGGEAGPVVSLRRPHESLLLRAVRHEVLVMPPKSKLPKADVKTLHLWLRLGAPFDPALESVRPAIARPAHAPKIDAKARAHFAFRAPAEVRPPVPRRRGWVRNPIDAFVLSRLEAGGLAPAPRASRQTLIRRAHHDLLGLPPSPERVRAFLADGRPDAFARLVDELLASPHYGERWGRHWLDLVRYAESNSFERDGTKPFVWRYRDWVIRAFNDDKPFDEFTVEQLAGDELDDVTADRIIATGYYRLGQWDDEPADPEQARFDELDDVLTTTSQAFLGLTINCARCHHHKIDPVLQDDYYRMLSFFSNVRRYGRRSHGSVVDASLRVIAPAAVQEQHRAAVAAWEKRQREVGKRLREIEEIVEKTFEGVEKDEFRHEAARVAIVKKRAGKAIDSATADEYASLTKERNKLRRERPKALEQALCVKESGAAPRAMHVLVRGNPHVRGRRVEPGFPAVLGFAPPEITRPKTGESTGRRLALARWIASPDNPLTARVAVNRIWQHHFGRGLVATPNDWGMQGSRPSHPRLLDWLAREFVRRGWRFKAMHRLILLSSTWQQDFRREATAEREDPSNTLLWRFEPRRLSAEEVRDSVLAVAGVLNRKLYGPSVYPMIPAEVLAGQSRPGNGWRLSKPAERSRRSVYVHVKRSLLLPILERFDAADTDFTCPVRFQTTQPTQALTMLNGAFAGGHARRFAEDLRKKFPGSARRQVAQALWRTTQRAPSAGEVARGVDFVRSLREREKLSKLDALSRFCLVTLNLNEFLHVR